MKSLVAALSRLDAAVQRRFDSACFFLMRRFGTRKSTMRYGLKAMFIIGMSGMAVDSARKGDPLIAALLTVILLVLLHLQHLTQRSDHAAEESSDGTVQPADPPYSGFDKLFASSGIVFASVATPLRPDLALTLIGCVMASLAYLLMTYLAKTPMNPPAERARESALSPQTAPANL